MMIDKLLAAANKMIYYNYFKLSLINIVDVSNNVVR